MSWLTQSDVRAYDAAAGDFVRSRPVSHTVPLSIAERVRRGGPTAVTAHPAESGHWTAPDGTVGAAEELAGPRHRIRRQP